MEDINENPSESKKVNFIKVDVDFFGKDLRIDTYAKRALNWAKNNLVNDVGVECKCLGKKVYFSTNKINHTIGHKRNRRPQDYTHEIIAVISVLSELITDQNTEFRYSQDDKNDRVNILKIHKLKGKIEINNTIKEIEIIIRETYLNKDEIKLIFYNHAFIL